MAEVRPALGVHELWRGAECLGAILNLDGGAPARLVIDDAAREAHERLFQEWEQAHPKASDEWRRRIAVRWAQLAAPDVEVRSGGYRESEWARTAWANAAQDGAEVRSRLALMRIQLYSVRDAHERPTSAPAIFSLTPADLHAATRQGTLTWKPACGVARATWCRMPAGLVYLAVFPWEPSAVLCAVEGAQFKTTLHENIGGLAGLVAPADTVAALEATSEWKAPEADWGAKLGAIPKAKYGDLMAIAPGGLYLLEMSQFDAMGAGTSGVHTTWSVIHVPSGKRVYQGTHESSTAKVAGVKKVEFAGEDEIVLTHEDGKTERGKLRAPA